MANDVELLRRFTEEHSEAAFRELVEQRIDFVYAAALRQVGGDVHLARDVAQSVFLDLTRKADALAQRASLAGWLYTSARFAAGKALRARARRQRHEIKAHAMNETLSASSADEINWTELRLVIDDAMHELNERDREAILLRFFENRPLADIGAVLGLAENSARMRVDRALEKLRVRLSKRGIVSTTTALGTAMAHQPSVFAPVGLATGIARVIFAEFGANAGAIFFSGTHHFMASLKHILGIVGGVALGSVGTYYYVTQRVTAPQVAALAENIERQSSAAATLRIDNQNLKTEINRSRAEIVRLTEAAKPDPLAKLHLLVEMKKSGMTIPTIQPGISGASLFAQWFVLADSDKIALREAWESVASRLDGLAATNVATLERNAKGDVVIRLNPFPLEGGKAFDELLAGYKRVLGEERYQAFLTLQMDQTLESSGHMFGATERTVTFSHATTSTDSKVRYTVRDQFKTSKGLPSYSITMADSREKLGIQYPALSKLLPTDF